MPNAQPTGNTSDAMRMRRKRNSAAGAKQVKDYNYDKLDTFDYKERKHRGVV